MAGINKVIIVGNLGADPESRSTPSGSAVTNIRVATSRSWRDKNSGQQQERTEWHRIVFFNRLAEIAGQYLRKGSKVYVEGELRTNQWERDGQKHYTTEIVANEMQMLDSRGSMGGGQGADEYPGNNNYGGTSANFQPQGQPQGGRPQGGGGNDFSPPPSDADFDDDIPF